MTARLIKGAPLIELKATYTSAGPGQEFVRQVSFSALEQRGAAAVAREFARDARAALVNTAMTNILRVHARRRAG
ncbi:MAG: hypothetical protein JSR36_16020 [Proteobacteria bacterium]|nr:hypothetical protein [Pseudomonadota bacterium]